MINSTSVFLYENIMRNNLTTEVVYSDKTHNLRFLIDQSKNVRIQAIDKNLNPVTLIIDENRCAFKANGCRFQQIDSNDSLLIWILNKLPFLSLYGDRILMSNNSNNNNLNINNYCNIQPINNNISKIDRILKNVTNSEIDKAIEDN